ncbi:MAG: ABC transporter ATP-binding protein [Sporolactobacillus sp.]|jgi:branched-chain amino acid transport system ATP-binding protein|nr:ABC transporter ATP-binding protein [Sporolactobacillus sp.]
MSESLMSALGISVQFGGLWAVKEVDMEVFPNEVLGIMGPNGAGKSTFLNVLSGLQTPTSGQIRIGGKSVTLGKPWKMTQLGLSRSFQTVRLLPQLSVLQNVLVGGHLYAIKNPWDVFLRTRKFKLKETDLVAKAKKYLRIMEVESKANQKSETLSMQERRRVEIARSLMTNPHILLLDEPCAGLSPNETAELSQMIRTIKKQGISIILVEHNVKMILSISNKIMVLDHGTKIAQGTPAEIANNEKVIKAYLGGTAGA